MHYHPGLFFKLTLFVFLTWNLAVFASAEKTNLLSPANQRNIKVFGQAMAPPILGFEPGQGTLRISRKEGPLQSCLVAMALTSPDSASLMLPKAGNSVGVRLALSYLPFSGAYLPKAPRIFFANSPWAETDPSGQLKVTAGTLSKAKAWGLILGQGNEMPNFWIRPEGGQTFLTSSRDGQSVGVWAQNLAQQPFWKKAPPVELIFSLTRLENGGLRYYGFCAGNECQTDLASPLPFQTDHLWLDLSNSNAKELLISTAEFITI